MKLLLIEDDAFFRNFYAKKLQEAGFEVELAEDGEQGLAKIASANPNLILLDIIMPKKDGFDVLQALKQTGKPVPPIIVFSTLGNEQDVQKALQLGAVDYINKSFHDFEILRAKITAHLPPSA